MGRKNNEPAINKAPNFKGKFQVAGSPDALQAGAASADKPNLSLEAHVKGDFSTASFDKIAVVQTGRGDVPVESITMTVEIVE